MRPTAVGHCKLSGYGDRGLSVLALIMISNNLSRHGCVCTVRRDHYFDQIKPVISDTAQIGVEEPKTVGQTLP